MESRFHQSRAFAAAGRVIPLSVIVTMLLTFLGMVVPVCFWLGASQLSIFANPVNWGNAMWPQVVAPALASVLFGLPLLWVMVSRRMDLIALTLAQNGLIVCGYYFVGTTAFHIAWEGREMLRFVPLVLLFNAIGFGALLLSLMGSYGVAALGKFRLAPLKAGADDFDRRLRVLLLILGVLAGAVIAAPMAASGVVPLLASDSTTARFEIVRSPALRAFYHMGTALLPFVVGGLVVGIARRPLRAIGLDGIVVVAVVGLQVLTSNRLPLAIGLVITATLLSMEFRLPRILLALAFAGYLVLFAGLSGFTALLRAGGDMVTRGNVIEASLQEAFLGDNLIDLRDGAWVFSHWNGDLLEGKTYLGGMASMLPSAVFPQKKEWHLGLTGVRMVGWDPEEHFGLRITFFGEAFLNFGLAGVIGLGAFLGAAFGILLRYLHLAGREDRQCLMRNLRIVLLMQMLIPLSNTSDAFTSWSMLAIFLLIFFFVDLPARWRARAVRLRLPALYAVRRA